MERFDGDGASDAGSRRADENEERRHALLEREQSMAMSTIDPLPKLPHHELPSQAAGQQREQQELDSEAQLDQQVEAGEEACMHTRLPRLHAALAGPPFSTPQHASVGLSPSRVNLLHAAQEAMASSSSAAHRQSAAGSDACPAKTYRPLKAQLDGHMPPSSLSVYCFDRTTGDHTAEPPYTARGRAQAAYKASESVSRPLSHNL